MHGNVRNVFLTTGTLQLKGLLSNSAELGHMTPTLALYYSFHTPSTVPLEADTGSTLGPSAALEELLSRGCSLATKSWVENHWCLILWKLAGMVYLDPEQEHDPKRKRWCWSEVIRQLLYR
jgi:breast cancer 2 susceptibility protein